MKDHIAAYDPCQQKVIEASGGHHLVLAPPGCGKTQILTERIRHAHAHGVAYGDMLCLTFTNRAARGMGERMQQNLTDADTSSIYVGNVHRFCSKFLFDNNIIAGESSVIDEDDAVSILARFLNEDELAVLTNYSRRRVYADVFHLAALMHQIEHTHPRQVRLHPECLTADDVSALRTLCKVASVEFTPESMLHIYRHTDIYRAFSQSEGVDYGSRIVISKLLSKMSLAWQYAQYKESNRLLDFEDLLLLTFDAYAEDAKADAEESLYRHYPWIQVDEVQDLNPLQLAIIDLITSPSPHTVMYLGDEQQAIFSFMGAKLSTLESLKIKCDGHVHHLNVNHRSCKYLLDTFNAYASDVLHIDKQLLPEADNAINAQGNELTILESDNYDTEILDIANRTLGLLQTHPDETTAIVVTSNSDADAISTVFSSKGISHFKVSGSDIFSQPEIKLLFAHLSVLVGEMGFLEWARILHGVGAFEQSYAARNFVRRSLNLGILPSDYLRSDHGTYLQDFCAAYDNEDMVVFDTETTGLNVFEDDIVQIAAVRLRRGKVVEGSQFSLFISTERPIPPMLGDIVNPIIEERKHHELLSPDVALRQFLDYAAGAPLLGHNADYDYNILDNTLRRYLNGKRLVEYHPVYFDSLKLIRLLSPELKAYKLKSLLATLRLEGQNSHLADEDVNATCGLVNYCRRKAELLISEQRKFMKEDRVMRRANIFRAYYAPIYNAARQRLYQHDGDAALPAMVDEIQRFYNSLLADGKIQTVNGLHYVTDYLASDVIDAKSEPSLIEQLSHHMMELNTMKEADLTGSSTMKERVFITTVHKAKGLEFNNVIVFDAVDGRWPNYYSQNNPRQLAEDARKFYVAITRATTRLVIAFSRHRISFNNYVREQNLTRFMSPLIKWFK